MDLLSRRPDPAARPAPLSPPPPPRHARPAATPPPPPARPDAMEVDGDAAAAAALPAEYGEPVMGIPVYVGTPAVLLPGLFPR
jgi:hypothetical protein